MPEKEGEKIEINPKTLQKIKAKIRKGESLNKNLENIKKIMEYIDKREEDIKIY